MVAFDALLTTSLRTAQQAVVNTFGYVHSGMRLSDRLSG